MQKTSLLFPTTTDPQEHQAPQKLTMSDIERGWKKYQSHCIVKRSDTKWCIAVVLASMKSAPGKK
eukprot:12376957-Ditylum_brightwellii.AAC.1